MMIKMNNKFDFYFGSFLSLAHLVAWSVYSETGCISMPRVHKLCGEQASGGVYASIITFCIGIYLILSGLGFFKGSKK